MTTQAQSSAPHTAQVPNTGSVTESVDTAVQPTEMYQDDLPLNNKQNLAVRTPSKRRTANNNKSTSARAAVELRSSSAKKKSTRKSKQPLTPVQTATFETAEEAVSPRTGVDDDYDGTVNDNVAQPVPLPPADPVPSMNNPSTGGVLPPAPLLPPPGAIAVAPAVSNENSMLRMPPRSPAAVHRTASMPVGALHPSSLQDADLFGGMASLSQPAVVPRSPSLASQPRGGMALGRWLQCRSIAEDVETPDREELWVECNAIKATLLLPELRVRMADTGELVAPGEFERRTGLGKCRKWKETVRVMGDAAERYKHIKLPASATAPPPSPGSAKVGNAPSGNDGGYNAVHRTVSAPVGQLVGGTSGLAPPSPMHNGGGMPPPPPPVGNGTAGASGGNGALPQAPRPPPARYGPYPPLGEWLRAPEARAAIVAADIKVECNTLVGVLRIAQNGSVVVYYDGEMMHCGEFERRSGKGRSRKWKETVRVLNGSHVKVPPPEIKPEGANPRKRKHTATMPSFRAPGAAMPFNVGVEGDFFAAGGPGMSPDDSDISGGDFFLYGTAEGATVPGGASPPLGPILGPNGIASPPDVVGGAEMARSLGLVPGGNSPPLGAVLPGDFSPTLPEGPDVSKLFDKSDDLLVFMPEKWE